MNHFRYFVRGPLPWQSAALLALFAVNLAAQTTGSIRGVVRDQTTAVVPNATINLLQEGGGIVRKGQTNNAGEYQFVSVPIGHYILEVEAEGFKKFRQTNLELTLGAVLVSDPVLEIGELTQTITAEATLPMVDTTTNQLGASVSDKEVVGLPLNARDTYQFMQLQPGVMSQLGADLFTGSDQAGVVSVNGGRGRSNNFSVNGGEANDLYVNLPSIQPSPDAIEEFRVLTSTYDAEYGRNSGAVVNVVTKGGTNEFHGNLFHFFRNEKLNSRGFFDTARPRFNQNQFGGTFGGPIKKDKTFFFTSYEGRRIRQGIPSDLIRVPNALERAGDFSQGDRFGGTLSDDFVAETLRNRAGCAVAVAAQGGDIAAGNPWSRVFPQNRIPQPCMDPTSRAMMNLYVPLPNSGDTFFQAQPISQRDADQFTARIDHTLTANQRLTGFYYFDDRLFQDPFASNSASGANLPGFGAIDEGRVQQINLTHNWIASPTTIVETRGVYFRQSFSRFNSPLNSVAVQDSCGSLLAPEFCFANPAFPGAGIRPGLGIPHEGVPYIGLTGGVAMGNNYQGELPQLVNTFQWTQSVSKVAGNHTIKFGSDLRRQLYNMTNYGALNGQFNFFPGGPNDVGIESQVPNFLLGLPAFFYQTSASFSKFRNTALYLYAQDSWKLRPNLTLNYGLRWEFTNPPADSLGRTQMVRFGQPGRVFPCRLAPGNPLIAEFGDDDCNPGGPAQAVFPLGLVVPGDEGVPPGLTQTYWKAFAPRLGLAWSPAAKSGWLKKLTGEAGDTSVRMGWGLSYNFPIEGLILAQFVSQPPFGGSSGITNPMFSTPFVTQRGQQRPNPFDGFLLPDRGEPLDLSVFLPLQLYGQIAPDIRPAYTSQYNFTLQRSFRNNLMLQAAYVGSQSHRLFATVDQNPGLAQPCLDLNRILGEGTCGPFGADETYIIPAGAIPAGFTFNLPYGSVPSVTGPNANPITLVGLRRHSSPLCEPTTGVGCLEDLPVYQSVFNRNSIAKSSYNSLQLLVNKRMSGGLNLQAAYTFSKTMDNASSFENILNPLNHRLSRSLSLFHATQRLVFSYLYKLPYNDGPGFTRKVFGGWTITGISAFQSGFPIRLLSEEDTELMNSYDFEFPGQPDIVAPFRRLDPRAPGNLFFDPAGFALSEIGTIGNAPRTICCGPGINNHDVAMLKEFKVGERYRVQFRSEIFNVFNHAQFLNPDGNISSGPDFGRIRRARPPRQVQFALKLYF
jgi:hypothetical protein